MKQKTEVTLKEKVAEGIENFFRPNKILLWVILGLLLVGTVAFYIINTNTQNAADEGAVLAENAQKIYLEWLNEKDENLKKSKEEELNTLIAQIKEEYPDNYTGQRGLFIEAGMLAGKKDWENAALKFNELYTSFPKTILAKEALLKEAVCQEQLGQAEKALELHVLFQEKYSDYHKYPYSLFSAGRINEQLKKYKEAAGFYEILDNEFPLSSWSKTAQNRLISLQANNLYSSEK